MIYREIGSPSHIKYVVDIMNSRNKVCLRDNMKKLSKTLVKLKMYWIRLGLHVTNTMLVLLRYN